MKNHYKIADSFPTAYAQAMARIEPLLQHNDFFRHSIHVAEQVKLANEIIQLFARQYANPKITISGLNDIEKTLVHCLYTRHHDGFVRQAHLQALLKMDLSSDLVQICTPFIFQLLGEYVLQIAIDCDKFIRKYPNEIKTFILQNPQFWFKQKQRITSYWNEYYRWGYIKDVNFYRNFKDYPLYRTIEFIEKLIQSRE